MKDNNYFAAHVSAAAKTADGSGAMRSKAARGIGAKIAVGILAGLVAVGAVTGGVLLHNRLRSVPAEEAAISVRAETPSAEEAAVSVRAESSAADAASSALEKTPPATSPGMPAEQAAAYYDVLHSIVDRVGVTDEHTDALGLAYAELIDFDGDGNEELYLYYIDKLDADGHHSSNAILHDEVWAWTADGCSRVYSDQFLGSGAGAFRDDAVREKSIIEADGASYLAACTSEWFGTGSSTEKVELMTMAGGAFSTVRTIRIDFSATPPYSPISGDVEQEQDLKDLSDKVFQSTRGHTGPYLEAYSEQDDSLYKKAWTTSDVSALMLQLRSAAQGAEARGPQSDYTPYVGYAQTIPAGEDRMLSEFALYDLDQDGVEELLAVCQSVEQPFNEYHVFSLDDNGELRELFDSGRCFAATFRSGFVSYNNETFFAVSYVTSDSGEADMTTLVLLRHTPAGYETAYRFYSYVTNENAWEPREECTLDDAAYPLADFMALLDSMTTIEMTPKEPFLQQYA